MTRHIVRDRARKLLEPVVGLLASAGVPPLLVSLAGLALSLYGAAAVAGGALALGAVLLLLAGLCDVLDGDLARRRGLAGPFGAFIDSTLDRVTEFAYFGGIILYLVNRPAGFRDYDVAVALLALAGSVLTSYARARAEGLGLHCKVGMMERPERIALLVLGLLFGYHVLVVVLTVMAAITMLTFVQRVVHVRRLSQADYTPTDS
ncbi:MAG: CDP-alcohol phosphatidyltransferase family protein [Candidatus Krumholzibacteria bacterium]|nr:CDP-alcohol phosphatidyltransferase family protein [Candidatus Krumholzibacteria bacterium]